MTPRSFLAIFLLYSSLAATGQVTSPKYPLEAAVFTVKATPGTKGRAGTGKASLREGNSYSGFDFTYECGISFMAYGVARPYPAKWKEKGKVLALRVTKIADPDVRSECDLQVTLLPTIYAEKDGKVASVSQAEYRKMVKLAEQYQEDVVRMGQKMPLRVYLVDSQWQSMNSLRAGTGKGNVIEQGKTTGFEFSGQCSAMALQKTSSSGFVGRWARPEKDKDLRRDEKEDKDAENNQRTKLIIAAPAPGDAETPSCQLDVSLKSVVYIRDGEGNIKEVPVAEYNKKK